ncbi:hypothetical protein, partial [Escherichia coli]|uniref:hypothetical protein n=1 Tax=Escherichia coli TaxID=562 RepID=UPI003CFCBCC8
IQASQLVVKIGVAKTGVTIDSVFQADPKCDYEKTCTEINQTIPASLNRKSGTAKRSIKEV